MNEVRSKELTPPIKYFCRVMSLRPLNGQTYQVELQAPEGVTLEYRAGQYLELGLDLDGNGETQPLHYSIANSFDPKHSRRLQLFIQSSSAFSARIITRLYELSDSQVKLKTTLPMGRSFLQTKLSAPHLLIASGSGISKIKCLTEEILKREVSAPIAIYWSNKNVDDFYLLSEFRDWASRHNSLVFTPILEAKHENWDGETGYIFEVVKRHYLDLYGFQAYLCGSPNMVYATIDALKHLGLREDDCYSDVFEYAPRKN